MLKATGGALLAIVGFLLLLLAILAVFLLANGASLRALTSFIPNLAGLITALYRDDRVPTRAKVSLAALGAYLVTPFDLIPDFIPFLGYLDDVIVVAVAFDGVLNQIDRAIVLEHWKGDAQSLEVVSRSAGRLSVIVPAGLKRRLFAGPRPGEVADNDR